MSVRENILSKASEATGKTRHEIYGDPFTDMNCAAEFEALYRKHAGVKYSPAHDEAMRRVFCKLARIACGKPGHEDSYVDLAAYIAIAFECQQQGAPTLNALSTLSIIDMLNKKHPPGFNPDIEKCCSTLTAKPQDLVSADVKRALSYVPYPRDTEVYVKGDSRKETFHVEDYISGKEQYSLRAGDGERAIFHKSHVVAK